MDSGPNVFIKPKQERWLGDEDHAKQRKHCSKTNMTSSTSTGVKIRRRTPRHALFPGNGFMKKEIPKYGGKSGGKESQNCGFGERHVLERVVKPKETKEPSE